MVECWFAIFERERERERMILRKRAHKYLLLLSTRPMPSSAAAVATLHVSHVRFCASARARICRWRLPAFSAAAAEGPSCLFVGPIDTASKEMLEALYHQARYSYYNGKPLIVDDMFDKVELKLRLYGSKSVVKYPRCSLRRQSTYADAEEDPSQVVALASVWTLLLLFGLLVIIAPIVCELGQAFEDTINSRYFLSSGRSPFDVLMVLNGGLYIGLGCLIGFPLTSASVQALRGLWKNDLVALKGSCPNCGEEVFAFVRAEKSSLHPHSTECHVCESSLIFRTKVEQSVARPRRRWVYGRIYLVKQNYDDRRRQI